MSANSRSSECPEPDLFFYIDGPLPESSPAPAREMPAFDLAGDARTHRVEVMSGSGTVTQYRILSLVLADRSVVHYAFATPADCDDFLDLVTDAYGDRPSGPWGIADLVIGDERFGPV